MAIVFARFSSWIGLGEEIDGLVRWGRVGQYSVALALLDDDNVPLSQYFPNRSPALVKLQ